jgi:hypothetical protein
MTLRARHWSINDTISALALTLAVCGLYFLTVIGQ